MATIWFILMMKADLIAALSACVAPFVLPDLIKAGLALTLGAVLRARLGARVRRT